MCSLAVNLLFNLRRNQVNTSNWVAEQPIWVIRYMTGSAFSEIFLRKGKQTNRSAESVFHYTYFINMIIAEIESILGNLELKCLYHIHFTTSTIYFYCFAMIIHYSGVAFYRALRWTLVESSTFRRRLSCLVCNKFNTVHIDAHSFSSTLRCTQS